MKQTILKTFTLVFLVLVTGLVNAEELKNLSVEQVEALQKKGDALIIDVRTEQEWKQSGIIPNSKPLQFFDKQGHANAKQWLAKLQQLKSSPDQPVVLVCRSGNRSGMVGRFLTENVGMKNISHLSTGIQSWIKAGKPVAPVCNNQPNC